MLSIHHVSVFLVVSFPLAFLPITYTCSSSLPIITNTQRNIQLTSQKTPFLKNNKSTSSDEFQQNNREELSDHGRLSINVSVYKKENKS
jgi:hypothetical protein